MSMWEGITPKEVKAMVRHAKIGVPSLLEALEMVLPLAEAYLAEAPSHPDQAKLESARAAIVAAKEAERRAP
jgi:hypothetical protein